MEGTLTMIKQIDFWFDPVSPFAYLAFERLPQVLEGVSHEVVYRPVLFAGLLAHWGQKGPAEIEPKRAWTFRHVHWIAQHHGIAMRTPVQHPFNPLAVLRLLLACAPEGGTPSRLACEAVLRHVWHDGLDANDPERIAALTAQLSPRVAADDPAVKQALKDSTAAAVARGLFGVPTFEVDGRQFWGLDALPMLSGFLRGEAWFDGPAWAEEDRAEGADDEAGCEREQREDRLRGRVEVREELAPDDRRERAVEVEVIPLEYRAQTGSEDDLLLFLRHGLTDF